MEKLTKSEKRVYEYLSEYIDSRGFSPSVRDIASALGFASSSTVHLYLSRLEDKGYIERTQKKSRSLRLTAKQDGIPLLGRVHAGLPVGVEEDVEEYIDVDASVLPYPKHELFALTVVGDSMTDAGIYEGDTLIVRKGGEPRDGDIIVAMSDGEVTVKTFYRENGHFRLQPENKNYAPIIVKELTVLGIVVTLVRKFK